MIKNFHKIPNSITKNFYVLKEQNTRIKKVNTTGFLLLRIVTENLKLLAYNITQTRRKTSGSYIAVKLLNKTEKIIIQFYLVTQNLTNYNRLKSTVWLQITQKRTS